MPIVEEIWIYPIKSMQGIMVNQTFCKTKGLLGDRRYALQEVETGYIASAKNPHKWKKLLTCTACYREYPFIYKSNPIIDITFPCGRVVPNDDPKIDQILSDFLGYQVQLLFQTPETSIRQADRSPIEEKTGTLVREEPMALASPKYTFFDHAPIHIITNSTLQTLHSLQPHSVFDRCRFRPNIVLSTKETKEPFPENTWLGQQMHIGQTRLQLIDPTPRCVVTTLAQKELPYDREVLRTIARHSQATSATFAPGKTLPATAGIYAQTITPGPIYLGAQIAIATKF